jgi:hypothetical protein
MHRMTGFRFTRAPLWPELAEPQSTLDPSEEARLP